MCRKVTCSTILLAESHCSARSLFFADVKVVPVFGATCDRCLTRLNLWTHKTGNPGKHTVVAKCAMFKTMNININASSHYIEYREIIQLLFHARTG